MQRISLLLCFLTLQCCTHQVYSLRVEPEVEELVHASVLDRCLGDDCAVGSCWREDEKITFCEVNVSFHTDSQIVSILSLASGDMDEQGHKVGFCGRDSFGTQMTEAFFVGMLAGASGSHFVHTSNTNITAAAWPIPSGLAPCETPPTW